MTKQRQEPPPLSTSTNKPHRLFPLPSNSHPLPPHVSTDDLPEYAQSRATPSAGAAPRRRKTLAPHLTPLSIVLDRHQVMELYRNCIHLAAENKINQKNTWELPLIDHLSEIIRVDLVDEKETNFQKASCVLEAGVKIYSLRVDSVRSEAYKVLGGISRAGRENNTENMPYDNINTEEGKRNREKETDRKISPLSTLESSFEVLNAKKFDVAFTVDPLYHQTSAQFDEDGFKGLLLHNLGVYGGCRVLFDSFEAPYRSIIYAIQNDKPELIDLSFAKEIMEKMAIHMLAVKDISPTLRDILNQFGEDSRWTPDLLPAAQGDVFKDDEAYNIHSDLDENAYGEQGPQNFCYSDHISTTDSSRMCTDPSFTCHQEDDYTFQESYDSDSEKIGRIVCMLCLGLGLTSESNAWAGPDHWKYRRAKDSQKFQGSASKSAKKIRNRKQSDFDIAFLKSLDKGMMDIFAPPKNPRSSMLPGKRDPCSTILPEDYHYKPESLVKLFVLPKLMCLGRKGRKSYDESASQNQIFDPLESWDNESMTNDQVDDGPVYGNMDDLETLVCQPRCQVNKIGIQYDKVSKQVDVHALKEVIWNHLQESLPVPEVGCHEATVSLRRVLHHFSVGNTVVAAGASLAKNVSTHLFFICLLHLANEHCLILRNHPNLDELDISIPSSTLAAQ